MLHIGTYVLYAVLVSLYVYQAHHRHRHRRAVSACIYTAFIHSFDVTSIHVSTLGINSNFPLTLSLASFSLARLAVASLASCHLPLPCRLAQARARMRPPYFCRSAPFAYVAKAPKHPQRAMAMGEKKLYNKRYVPLQMWNAYGNVHIFVRVLHCFDNSCEQQGKL